MQDLRFILVLFLFVYVVLCDATSNAQSQLEGRGKKKKIALFVYFADLIVKKLFVLKLIYAFVLWCVIHKAGYFLGWFVGYLKEMKHDHHGHYPHHAPHYDHGYDPYSRESWGR